HPEHGHHGAGHRGRDRAGDRGSGRRSGQSLTGDKSAALLQNWRGTSRSEPMHAAARDDAMLRDDAQASRLWHAVLYVYLAYVFVTGGSSQERGWTDAVAELVALPILAFACWRLVNCVPSRVRMWGVVALAAVALLPW